MSHPPETIVGVLTIYIKTIEMKIKQYLSVRRPDLTLPYLVVLSQTNYDHSDTFSGSYDLVNTKDSTRDPNRAPDKMSENPESLDIPGVSPVAPTEPARQ